MKTKLPSDISILWELYRPFVPYFQIEIQDVELAIQCKSPLVEALLLKLNLEIYRSRITDLLDEEENIKMMIQEARSIRLELEERQLHSESANFDQLEKLVSITDDLNNRLTQLKEIEKKRKITIQELAEACDNCKGLTEQLLNDPQITGEPRLERLMARVLENKWQFNKPKLKKETNKLELATCQIDIYGEQ